MIKPNPTTVYRWHHVKYSPQQDLPVTYYHAVMSFLVLTALAILAGALYTVPVEKGITLSPHRAMAATTNTAPPLQQPEVVTPTLELVEARRTLRCGINGNLLGFSYIDRDTGAFAGFDVDICRAIAAAVLGDANAVTFVPLNIHERFEALQTGRVDLLSRNTIWTATRDITLGVNFGPITFYDGQGFMARVESEFNSLRSLDDATICVRQDDIYIGNLTAANPDFDLLVLPNAIAAIEAYDTGACDALSTSRSQLVGQRLLMTNPAAHRILPLALSKEPLAPVVRHGDDQWLDIVTWVIQGLLTTEELGINAENVFQIANTSEDQNVRFMLGGQGTLGLDLGLHGNFMIDVIQQAGNYEEIYTRNLGPETLFSLPRDSNNLYRNGGLFYSYPFR